MAAHARLKNEVTEDEKSHNLVSHRSAQLNVLYLMACSPSGYLMVSRATALRLTLPTTGGDPQVPTTSMGRSGTGWTTTPWLP